MKKFTLVLAFFIATTSLLAQTIVELQQASRVPVPGQVYEQTVDVTPPAPSVKGLLNESFEGSTFPPSGWTTIDQDGDGEDWFMYDYAGTAQSGTNSAASASWTSAAGALTPNNFLITPAITPVAGESLRYYVAPQDPDYAGEKYFVKISTTGTSASDFTTVLFSETLTTADADWKMQVFSLDAYAGQQIYIAFVHNDCTDMFYIKFDDIAVGTSVFVNQPREAITVEMFPNPANTQVELKSNSRIINVKVLNIIGQTVSDQLVDDTQTTLDVSELKAGVYFVQMETNNGIHTERLIVE